MRRDKDTTERKKTDSPARDENRDPITKAPGAHPVGVGIGTAAGGAAAGAAAGAIGGPVGAVAGAVVGGVVGGLAGKGVAEKINPTVEHDYWRENYTRRPYVRSDATYEDYGPAYEYGWAAFSADQFRGRDWQSAEPDLEREWEARRGQSRLSWSQAREATRDAWNRCYDVYGGGHCDECP